MDSNNASSAVPECKESRPTAFLLWHTDSYGDEKLIGVYATSSDASLAIERLKNKPRFSDGGDFEIVEYELNKDHWTDGFVRREGFSLPAWFHPSN